jgi:hypothetical protein
MHGLQAPFDQQPLDDIVFPDTHEPKQTVRERIRQHKMDSFMESLCNIAVGFIISWAVWMYVVAPLFNLPTNHGTGFLITCVFTVTSLARQYILRRLFDGRTIWETISAKIAR